MSILPVKFPLFVSDISQNLYVVMTFSTKSQI